MKHNIDISNYDDYLNEGIPEMETPKIEIKETKSKDYILNSIIPVLKWIGLTIIFIGLIMFGYNNRKLKIESLVETASKIGDIKEINITETGSIIDAKFKIKIGK